MTIICQPVDKAYPLTSGFGHRWGSLHDGQDYGIPSGTPLYAAHDGVVRNLTDPGGYGLYVQVDGPECWTQYGHMSRTGAVPTGTFVKAGTLIGWSGNTGSSTGPHLHFRYRPKGAGPTDPAPHLRGKPFATPGGGSVAAAPVEVINPGAIVPAYV